MSDQLLYPDYIFETSWEVCNKNGGIYTVLSTRAKTLVDSLHDNLIFLGPDCWEDKKCPFFIEDSNLFADWKCKSSAEGLNVKIGRWDVPGTPVAVLVDFKQYFKDKNAFYGQLWNDYKVDSLHAYGDYDECAMFSYAAAKVVESFYNFYIKGKKKARVIFHSNEWQTGFALLCIKKWVPEIATVFTTHATSIGRSIAGNGKPLYAYLPAYNGDQMAGELNMQSKHSIEKQTAWNADCFTTVSDITARECEELLDKPVDCVLPNGFEDSFVPHGQEFTKKREAARRRMFKIANCLTGRHFDKNTLVISTSGRYEWRNKGIDEYIEAMNRLRFDRRLKEHKVLVFIDVPAWVKEPRKDLQERLETGKTYDTALELPVITQWLNNMDKDNVLGMLRNYDFRNEDLSNVTIIFIPSYLIGDDGIVNMSYYDFVLGNDLSVYPSYYEPWGYTPLESVAFKVPTITTDLAGFGLWVNSVRGHYSGIEEGVKVIHRDDYNYSQVADDIKDTVIKYASMSAAKRNAAREEAGKIAKKALWSEFIKYYEKAYDTALRNAIKRNGGI